MAIPPDVLYRYYSADRIQSALDDYILYFSSPSHFNDIFDSGYPIPISADPSAIKVRRRFLKDLGIACLSANPDQHLMWVNYADRHRGFVVGYRTTDPAFTMGGATLDEVTYSDEKVGVPTPGQEPRYAYTKSTDWRYEDEWRCVRRFGESESREIKVQYSSIAKVILGSRMERHRVSQVMQSLMANAIVEDGHEVPLFESESVVSTRRFQHLPTCRGLCMCCGGVGHAPLVQAESES